MDVKTHVEQRSMRGTSVFEITDILRDEDAEAKALMILQARNACGDPADVPVMAALLDSLRDDGGPSEVAPVPAAGKTRRGIRLQGKRVRIPGAGRPSHGHLIAGEAVLPRASLEGH